MANLTLLEYTNAALDVAYTQTAGPMLAQVRNITTAPGSGMQRALSSLDAEAERLEAEAARLEADSAEIERALFVLAAAFSAASALILANDNAIQASGQAIAVPAVTAKVFTQIANLFTVGNKNPVDPARLPEYKKALDALGVKWNLPAALDFATNYVDSGAWLLKMEGWGSGYSELARETILDGIRNGWGPKYTAQELRKLCENMPYYAAENLTRTLQLTSYRDASAAMDNINGEFIEYKLRIAKLDDRTCLSCIAKHGTRLEKGERVDDHYRGRCTEFYVVRGGPRFPETMQADSTPGNRRFVPWQSGEKWFSSLPENRQKRQASFTQTPGKWNAFKGGVPLSEFVGDHQDDVFGHQIIERSLRAVLGDNAQQYYQRNQVK